MTCIVELKNPRLEENLIPENIKKKADVDNVLKYSGGTTISKDIASVLERKWKLSISRVYRYLFGLCGL